METISRYVLTFLLNAAWQILLVTIVAVLVQRFSRKCPASYRHAIWVAALVVSIILPAASVRTRSPAQSFDIQVSMVGTQTGLSVPSVQAPARVPATSHRTNRTVTVARLAAAVVVYAYLMFLLFRLAGLALAWRRTLAIRKSGRIRPLPPVAAAVWARCEKTFGVRNVELLASCDVSGPVTVGVWRRTVVLPEALFDEASVDVLTTAVGHELAHVSRHDFALKMVYELLLLPLSFHPGAWLIRRNLERTRELACDALVAQKLLEPKVYAQSILRIASQIAAPSPANYTLGVLDGDILEERIQRLLARPAANLRRARLLLATGLAAVGVCAVLASALSFTARAQGGFDNEMKMAESAYNSRDWNSAVQHFEHAVRMEPVNIKAKLFLANTLLRQHEAERLPAESPLIAAALQQYQDVLALDGSARQALQGMVAITMKTGQSAAGHDWALKLTQAAPNDKTAYYTAAVLDWATVYPEFQRAKQASGGKMEDYTIADANIRVRLRERCLPQVEEGIQFLTTALQLDPSYHEAMAYMNLLFRLKAGLADDPGDAAHLIATADGWVHKALAAKRVQAARPAQSWQIDVAGAAPGPASGQIEFVMAPPPPPPPGLDRSQQIASDVEPPKPRGTETPGQYWQVTGRSEMTARLLFNRLRERGFQASVYAGDDNLTRVMVGPFFDTSSIEKAKPALEAAGFRPIRVW